MENQKIMNLLDNAPNQLSKLRTKSQVEIDDESHGTYNTNCQIKFKSSMLKSILCDYKRWIYTCEWNYKISNTGAPANPNNRENVINSNKKQTIHKQIMLKTLMWQRQCIIQWRYW